MCVCVREREREREREMGWAKIVFTLKKGSLLRGEVETTALALRAATATGPAWALRRVVPGVHFKYLSAWVSGLHC